MKNVNSFSFSFLSKCQMWPGWEDEEGERVAQQTQHRDHTGHHAWYPPPASSHLVTREAIKVENGPFRHWIGLDHLWSRHWHWLLPMEWKFSLHFWTKDWIIFDRFYDELTMEWKFSFIFFFFLLWWLPKVSLLGEDEDHTEGRHVLLTDIPWRRPTPCRWGPAHISPGQTPSRWSRWSCKWGSQPETSASKIGF